MAALAARCNLIRTTKVRCRNRVDNFIAINHQFRLSVTTATELYLLPFFCTLTHVHVPFFWCDTYPEVIIQSSSFFWNIFLLFSTIQHSFDML